MHRTHLVQIDIITKLHMELLRFELSPFKKAFLTTLFFIFKYTLKSQLNSKVPAYTLETFERKMFNILT